MPQSEFAQPQHLQHLAVSLASKTRRDQRWSCTNANTRLECKDDTSNAANNKHAIRRREKDAPRRGRALASEGRGALGHFCTSLPRRAFAAPALAPKPSSWHRDGPSASRPAPCPPFPHVSSWVWTRLCALGSPCHTKRQQVQASLFCPRHFHARGMHTCFTRS